MSEKWVWPWLGIFFLFLMGAAGASEGLRSDFSPSGWVASAQRLPDGRRLVLLGTQSSDARYPTGEEVRSWGFEGNLPTGAAHFDPAFIVVANEKGVRDVYSFELGTFMTARQIQNLGTPRGRAQNPDQFKSFEHPEKRASLPPHLLSVPHARRDLGARFTGELFLTGAQFTLAGPIAAAVLLYWRQVDKVFDRQAAFLSRAVQLELMSGKTSELGAVFSREELEQLGSALLVRYNLGSLAGQWKGLLVSKKKRTEFYYKTLGKRAKRELEHLQALEKRAKEKGLTLSRLGPGFALLSVPREAVDFSSDAVSPGLRKWAQRYRAPGEGAGELIPYRIYVLDESHLTLDTVSFDSPLRDSFQSKVVDLTHWATGLGFNSFDLIPGLSVGIGSQFMEWMVDWMGVTLFDYRIAANSRLEANLKLGATDLSQAPYEGLDGRSILIAVLLDHARAIGVPETEVKALEIDLANASREDLGRAIAQMMGQLVELENRSATSIETTDLEEARRTKRIHLARLKNWIGARESSASSTHAR